MNALILGASGLVGHELLELLVMDKRFEQIDLLSRRELKTREISVVNHLVDFSNLAGLPIFHKVDTLFIAFGTTLKKAGSQAKQWEIDVDIPTNIMKLAKESGIENCVLVSALGVSKKSPFFYSKMKAQLDDNAESMGFKKLILVKPSVLEGPRVEKRLMEEWTITIGNLIGKTGLINKFKPVEAINVAKAMIQGLIDLPDGTHEISSDEIHEYAKRYTEDEFRKEIGQN
ncbi:MAG: hypothetical protein ACK47F_10630 [Flavobacteriales bacterium]